ncbi:hypothetical protein EMCRGX_G006267 [Ephydatia muelleri]
MQHFDAGNYHLINIHKCLFIQCTAVARELYGDNSVIEAAMELGYSSMKPEQVIFAILPTGFGSPLLCPAVAFDKCQKKERGYSIVVVVSPLVAIMKDQVSTYSIKGLKTTYVSGEVTDKSVLDEVSQGNFQLVFFTPEMLIGKMGNNLQASVGKGW